MLIDFDNNEQLPYSFTAVPRSIPYELRKVSLYTGDYQCCRVNGNHDGAFMLSCCCVIERKTLSDLYGTVARGRKRFEAELARMKEFGYAAIVIEAEWSQILNPNAHLRHPTRYPPKSMLASLLAWEQRYGVHVHALPGREVAERFTFRILERWYRDHEEKKSESARQVHRLQGPKAHPR